MAIPNGVIKICKGVPLSNDYKHTLWFNNDSLMFQYFESKVAKTYSKYNIIRDTKSIRVEATLDEARTWNYMYFQYNGTGGGKIYFAFITRIVYVNESTVELFYEVDVMTSYMWQYSLKQCFVEREHTTTDNYYGNLIDEGLEVGEYIDAVTTYPEIGEMCVLIMSTIHLKSGNGTMVDFSTTKMANGYIINKSYTAMMIYAVDADSIGALNSVLSRLNNAGKSDAIIAMWMYPKALVKLDSAESWGESSEVKLVDGVKNITQTITPATDFGGYTPINKKLYSFPFNYIYVSNNAGGSAFYKHELIKNNTPQSSMSTIEFKIGGAISPEASVRMYPTNYRKKGNNFEEGISLGTYPSCAWASDTYKLWLAQNQNQLDYSMKSAKLSTGLGVATGLATAIGMAVTQNYIGAALGVAGAVGSVISGTTQVDNILAQKADKEIQPPNAGGSYTANINIAEGYQTFTISRRTISARQAKIIDDYFTRFGYACREIKVPNRRARKSFTYVKTVDCQIEGNLSHEIIQKIQSIYDSGVTIWADPSVIGVYTCDNSCI